MTDTKFQFGYSDNPNSVCSFCGSVSGMFCLTKEAAVECGSDAESVRLRSKLRPMTREQVIARITRAFLAESSEFSTGTNGVEEECEQSLAEALTWIETRPTFDTMERVNRIVARQCSIYDLLEGYCDVLKRRAPNDG